MTNRFWLIILLFVSFLFAFIGAGFAARPWLALASRPFCGHDGSCPYGVGVVPRVLAVRPWLSVARSHVAYI